MPTWLMIVAPTGVLTIVLLTWALGGLYRGELTADRVKAFLLGEEPPVELLDWYLDGTRRCALVWVRANGDETLGVVTTVGDGLAWRPLGSDARIEKRGASFRVRPGAFTFPAVHFKRAEGPPPAPIKVALQERGVDFENAVAGERVL